MALAYWNSKLETKSCWGMEMLRYVLPFMVLMVVLLGSCRHSKVTQPEPYIPNDLDDAHAQLLKLLPSDEISRIKSMKSEDEMMDYHFGLGAGLRNSWGLWGNSRLAQYFQDMGIHHADDMSGIILDTFWCKLHGQSFNLDLIQARFYARG